MPTPVTLSVALNNLSASPALDDNAATGMPVVIGGVAYKATRAQLFNPPANATGVNISTYSLTGSDTHPAINVTGTWNTTGAPTLVKFNVTDTASDAASLIFDFQKNGSSLLKLDKSGNVTLTGGGQLSIPVSSYPNTSFIGFADNPSYPDGLTLYSSHTLAFMVGGQNAFGFGLYAGLGVLDNLPIYWTSGMGSAGDVFLYRGGTSILSQFNPYGAGASAAQVFRVYNVYIDTNNGEWFAVDWQQQTSICHIGTFKNGTGSARDLVFHCGASALLSVGPNGIGAWNVATDGTLTGGGTFNIKLQIGGSIIFDTTGGNIGTSSSQKFAFWGAAPVARPANTLGLDTLMTTLGLRASGGVANFDTSVVLPGGAYNAPSVYFSGSTRGWYSNGGAWDFTSTGGNIHLEIDNYVRLDASSPLEWSSNVNNATAAGDVRLFRGGAGIFAQYNTTNAQVSQVYNTYVDSSNGEWFTVDWQTTSNVCTIGTKANGTGSVRSLVISSPNFAVDASGNVTQSGGITVSSGGKSFLMGSGSVIQTTFITDSANSNGYFYLEGGGGAGIYLGSHNVAHCCLQVQCAAGGTQTGDFLQLQKVDNTVMARIDSAGNFITPSAVCTGVKAGTAADGDVGNPTDGMMRLDSTNNRVYFRISGTWKYASLT